MLAATGLPARLQPRVLIAPAAVVAVLLFAHLLPTTGIGAAIRLAAAALVVLVLPGALITRALGWPDSVGVAAAASVSLSLAVAAVALAAAFLVGGSFTFALLAGGAITLGALGFALVGDDPAFERADLIAAGGLALAVLPVAGVFWWVNNLANGDDLFHLARIVKLEELPSLDSLSSVGEFANGGLHPGYAFPLWHGVVAAVAKLAGVSPETAVLHLGQVVAPLTAAIAYGAGRALFSSWAGGIALAAAQVALWSYDGQAAAFRSVSDPETAGRALVSTAVLALVFAFLQGRGYRLLIPLAAGSLTLAMIHPNYPIYVLILLAGFFLAALVVNRSRPEAVRLGAASAAVAIPAAVFVLALWPVISENVQETRDLRAHDVRYYAGDIEGTTTSLHEAPGAITRKGGLVVVGLLCLPLAAIFARRRWGAYAAGGAVAILVLALTPPLFTRFADAASIAQARRLVDFLPLAAAIGGAAVLASRGRALAVALAAAAGIALALAYPGEWTFLVHDRGPAWPVWIGLAGAVLGLAVAAVLRPLSPAPTLWAAAIAVALVLPPLVSALVRLDRTRPDPVALTPGLRSELEKLPPGVTVFADPAVSYRILAAAPVYVASAPPVHVALNEKNHPVARARDARRFFSPRTSPGERARILSASGAAWLVVDRLHERPGPVEATVRCAYSDERYELFSVQPGERSSIACP